MLIVYLRSTLVVEHCVHVSGDDYRAFVEADPLRGCVEIGGAFQPDEVGVELVAGVAQAFVRQPFAFTAPDAAAVGATVAIAGVPDGTQITGDGGFGVMDATGLLEVSFETPGVYRLAFSHPRFLYREHSLAIAVQ